MRIKKNKIKTAVWMMFFAVTVTMTAGCSVVFEDGTDINHDLSLNEVPDYSGQEFVELNENEPEFSEKDRSEEAYEEYSELDSLGRCGMAQAMIGEELMPDEKRSSIGQVKPTGWHTVKYDNVDGKYLYNRCHLIGYQLTAENANEKNLITGTRYMNVEGMLPFENMVADYIKETGNHVLYRVTPVFEGENLVASGVQMEAESVEDDGEGICYNVFVYNVQPGIDIDYATGESEYETDFTKSEERQSEDDTKSKSESQKKKYILNTSSKKFHKPDCDNVGQIKEENKKTRIIKREELLQEGYDPCGSCKP